jgi:hypothetical protein
LIVTFSTSRHSTEHFMFTPLQSSTLRATIDRIIPADDFPSASQAGGMRFIDRLFRSDLAHRVDELRELLDAIDAAAQTTHRRSFESLNPTEQDALLQAIERSTAGRHFAWLVEVVNEGYYADPGNGGNDGAVSWKMVGYEPRVPGYDPQGIESGRATVAKTEGCR